jgi:uncharacterized membrane protein YcgQ (UPF0703/DUF1980 family)
MQSLFARWLPAATLATWSAVLLYFHFSLRMKSMLAPEFGTYALLAAIVLGVMALSFVLFKGDATCCSSGECGHGLSRLATGKLLTFLILLVPIVVAARFTPREGFSFSKTLVENRGTDVTWQSSFKRPIAKATVKTGGAATSLEQIQNAVTPAADGTSTVRTPVDLTLPSKDGSQPPAATAPATPAGSQPPATENKVADYLVRTPDGTIVAEVLDLLYAAQDNLLRKDFEGHRVELVGQFMPDSSNNTGANRFKAVRMFMTCCAADARPVATLVEADKLPLFPEMTWVKITGTANFPVEKGRRISVLKAEKVEKTEPPAEAMIY